MKVNKANYYKAVCNIADRLNLSEELVDKIYKGFWLSIKSTIEALPLKDSLTEEEFSGLTTSFNIPSLGKLSVTWDRYSSVKKRFECLTKLRENVKDKEGEADVQSAHNHNGLL